MKAEEKDPRFRAVAWMINARKGGIKKFNDIFDYIPKTQVANEMGYNITRFNRLIDNPLEFKLSEIEKLAGLLGCTGDRVIKMIRKQMKNPGL